MTIHFDDANFEKQVLKSEKPVLIDFFTPTCGPCRKLAPTIDKLAIELKDIVTIGKVDLTENMNIAVNYKISAVPTLILFKNGKEVKRSMGVLSEDELKKLIEENM